MENNKTDIFNSLNEQLKYVMGTDEYTLPKKEEYDFSIDESESKDKIKLEYFIF